MSEQSVLPVARESIRVVAPPPAATGAGAVWSSFVHAQRELGLVRGTRLLMQANQVDGFDCPGCAWPDPAPGARAAFEYCENGAKAVAAEATDARVDRAFFANHPIEALLHEQDVWLERQGRLTEPMVRRRGATHYEPIAWDEAFSLIAARLQALESPHRAAFYTSGRTSNEAAWLLQLLVRSYGTNNLPDCSNMCHESSGYGLSRVIGIGKGTVTLECFDKADAIFVFGQNPATNHPRMLSALEGAVRRGATIVAINPLHEVGLQRFKHPQKARGWVGSGTALASHYLQVRIGGDVALIKGLCKAILAHPDGVDKAFVDEKTVGFEAFAEDVRQTSWDDIVLQSGVPRAQIEGAAEVARKARAMICCWAMGLTQHPNGVANVQSVVNLLLLGGHFGRPGAGACPVRGHSNVQGDRTVGITARPKPAFLDRLESRFGFEAPREAGLDTVQAIEAMRRGEVDVFFSMGGNFLNAAPDTDRTAAGLRRCGLTVQVATKLNRSHLVTGEEALILPCLGRTEDDRGRFVTVENSMGIVHRSQGRKPPASERLRSEPEIVCGIAQALLPATDDGPDWAAYAQDYDRIRDDVEATVPGFEDYNGRVRQPGGFALPNGPREGTFPTADGKAHFTVHALPDLELPAGHLRLMTVRSHDQYNTTIYDVDDRYRGILGGRRVVLLNPEDIGALGLRSGQHVTLVSHFDGETREAPAFVVVPYDVPRGCAAGYFPEMNPLVPLQSTAQGSNTPTSKSIVITVRAE